MAPLKISEYVFVWPDVNCYNYHFGKCVRLFTTVWNQLFLQHEQGRIRVCYSLHWSNAKGCNSFYESNVTKSKQNIHWSCVFVLVQTNTFKNDSPSRMSIKHCLQIDCCFPLPKQTQCGLNNMSAILQTSLSNASSFENMSIYFHNILTEVCS